MEKSKISNDFLGTVVLTLLFSAVFVFTNIYDWDYVFTTLEVDLRSFVLDGKFPSWSYQMCTGSTRAGDPQSYGYSPLFLLPVLFGSFWGAKLILLTSVGVGFYYLKKILDVLNPALAIIERHLLVFIFLTGNFFLFHFASGHLSFSSIFYAFPLLYLCIKIVLGKVVENKEYLWNSMFLTLLMSGGFYQASIYFILPLALSFGLYLLFNLKKLNPIHYLDLSKLIASSCIPLILTIYRLLPVWDYQKQFPRTLNLIETNSPLEQLLFFTLPINGLNYAFPFKVLRYSAGEDSFFGGLIILFIGLIIFRFKLFLELLKSKRPIVHFSLFLMLIGFLLSSGNGYSFLPFALINKLTNGSVRVPSRFNIVTYLGIFILIIELLKLQSLSQKALKSFYGVGVLVALSCFFQHYSMNGLKLSLFQMKRILNIDPIYEEHMQTLHVTKMRDGMMSYMYLPTLLGMGVPNCYQPMTRDIHFMVEKVGLVTKSFDMPFIETGESPESQECRKQSYFTQSDIYLDKSCKPGTHLNMNFIQPEIVERYGLKATKGGYEL